MNRQELVSIQSVIGLLHSMIAGGEQHSKTSDSMIWDVMQILNKEEIEIRSRDTVTNGKEVDLNSEEE